MTSHGFVRSWQPWSVFVLVASQLIGCGGDASGTEAAGGSTSTPNDDSGAVTVTIDSTATYQTLEGFGAAVAWYQSNLVDHSQKAEIYTKAFAELGLDILRFRNTYARSSGTFSVDAEKEILEQATASLGRRPKVLLTSWSPPASLKASGQEDCTGNTDCTLKKTNGAFVYDEFATYWLDSLNAYSEAGIVPDFVSIQNEPDYIPYSWEGCKFEPEESDSFPGYATALEQVQARLETLESPPLLLGPETLGVHYGKVTDYVSVLDKSLLYATAHHLYEMGSDNVWDWRDPGPDSYTDDMMDAAQASGELPIFETEFQTDADNGTEGGFETAWLIHNSLAYEGVSAWLYWDLVWSGSGLISLSGSSSYTLRDQYYSLRHYARYTDPGYVRIGASSSASDIRVTAFRSEAASQLTVVVLNVGSAESTVAFDWGTYAPTMSEVYRTVYNPGSSETWVSQPRVDDGGILTLPSRSIATVVLSQ